MEEKFKVGDRVKGLGMTGVIVKSSSVDKLTGFDVKVKFDNSLEYAFISDGRFFKDGEPCLELIERPKQKVKRTYYKVYWTDCGGDEIYESAYTKSVDEFKKQFPEYSEIIKIEEREFEVEE